MVGLCVIDIANTEWFIARLASPGISLSSVPFSFLYHIRTILTMTCLFLRYIYTHAYMQVGPVAIIVPLRGRGGVNFSVHLSQSPLSASDSVVLLPPRLLPNLLQLAPEAAEGSGGGKEKDKGKGTKGGESKREEGAFMRRMCALHASSFQAHFPMEPLGGSHLLSDRESCLRVPAKDPEKGEKEEGTNNRNASSSGWDVATSLRSASKGQEQQGLLVSGVFALPVHNTQAHPLSLQFRLESPSRVGPFSQGGFTVRPARSALGQNEGFSKSRSNENGEVVVGPGQV